MFERATWYQWLALAERSSNPPSNSSLGKQVGANSNCRLRGQIFVGTCGHAAGAVADPPEHRSKGVWSSGCVGLPQPQHGCSCSLCESESARKASAAPATAGAAAGAELARPFLRAQKYVNQARRRRNPTSLRITLNHARSLERVLSSLCGQITWFFGDAGSRRAHRTVNHELGVLGLCSKGRLIGPARTRLISDVVASLPGSWAQRDAACCCGSRRTAHRRRHSVVHQPSALRTHDQRSNGRPHKPPAPRLCGQRHGQP